MLGLRPKNEETEQRVIPYLGNSGGKNPEQWEYEFGGYEQLKRDSVDILKDF